MKELIKTQMRSLEKSEVEKTANFVIEQAVRIQEIAAPTFQEEKRSTYIVEQFKKLGLKNVRTDNIHNVYGVLKGCDSKATGVMVSAHLDTVFPADTDLSIKRTKSTIHGPGIGDNSLGLAGMLGLAQYCSNHNIIPARNLLFVATSREEGLGNMGGMRQAFQKLRKKTGLVVNVEGLAFGEVFTFAPAIRRMRITVETKGGHSWDCFGEPSANHALCRLGAEIASISPPEKPRTTYNIGTIRGGRSVNSIADEAEMWLDLRSEAAEALLELEDRILVAVNSLKGNDIKLKVKSIGNKKPSHIESDHPLVRGALSALEEVGHQGKLSTGSTDARIPLLHGCPAVTIGISRGGNGHKLDEYVKTHLVSKGVRQLTALALAASEYLDNKSKGVRCEC